MIHENDWMGKRCYSGVDTEYFTNVHVILGLMLWTLTKWDQNYNLLMLSFKFISTLVLRFPVNQEIPIPLFTNFSLSGDVKSYLLFMHWTLWKNRCTAVHTKINRKRKIKSEIVTSSGPHIQGKYSSYWAH